MKEEILNALREGADSFVNLLDCVPGLEGNAAICIGDHNIVLWPGLNLEAVDALRALLNENKIKFVPTSPLVYLFDGRVPNFPIAKTTRNYKKPHWLPVVIKLVK